MKIIDRHVSGTFLAAFVQVIVGLVLIFVLFDLFLRLSGFIALGFTVGEVARYYLYYTGELTFTLLPVAIVVSVMWGIGRLARNNEITACRSAGISLHRMNASVYLFGALAAVVALFVGDLLVAGSKTELRDFRRALKGKVAQQVLRDQVFYTDAAGARLSYQEYDPRARRLKGVMWETAPEATPYLKVYAESGEWVNDMWWLYGVNLVWTDAEGREIHSEYHAKRRMYEWRFVPEEMSEEKRETDMRIAELAAAIRKIRRISPERARRMSVEMHRKMALPVLSFLAVLISLPFAVRVGGGRQVAVGFAAALVLCLGYYGLYMLVTAIGRRPGVIPWIVWLPNVVFVTVGGYLTAVSR